MSAGWTHALAYDDVVAMLECAEPGMAYAAWVERAIAGGRLLTSSQRTSQLRYARAILGADVVIPADSLLGDLRNSNNAERREIVYGRYLATHPLAIAVTREVFHPAIAREESTITRGALQAMLTQVAPHLSPSTQLRTLSSIVIEFSRAGVLHASRDRDAPLRFTRRVPSPLATLHVLNLEFREHRGVTDDWLTTSSLAALLFALDPETMARQVDRLIGMGRLRRSYTALKPQIVAA